MSLSIQFTGAADGDDGPFSLASASAWTLFAEWVEQLPEKRSRVLRRLTDAGEAEDTSALAQELAAGLKARSPENPAVADIAALLQELVGVGDAEETVTVLN